MSPTLKPLETITHVTIPCPARMPRARGIAATTIFNDMLKGRCSRPDKQLVERVAKQLGTTPGAFVRWCAVFVAAQIEKESTGVLPDIIS